MGSPLTSNPTFSKPPNEGSLGLVKDMMDMAKQKQIVVHVHDHRATLRMPQLTNAQSFTSQPKQHQQ